MAAPQVADLEAFLGPSATVDPTQGAALLAWTSQIVSGYTRGVGFTGTVPNADLCAVILSASARVWAHPRQLRVASTEGEESVSWGEGFAGFNMAEIRVLDRYRVTAV